VKRIFWHVKEVGSNLSGVVRPLVQDVEHAAENAVDMVARQYLPNAKRPEEPRLNRTEDEAHREEGSLMGKVSHLAL
jgi:acetyl-CoA carboxylase carboxyltransferase component